MFLFMSGLVFGQLLVIIYCFIDYKVITSKFKIPCASFFKRIKNYTHYKIIAIDYDRYVVMIGDGINYKFLRNDGYKIPGGGSVFTTYNIKTAEERAKRAILKQLPALFKAHKVIKESSKNKIIMDNACK